MCSYWFISQIHPCNNFETFQRRVISFHSVIFTRKKVRSEKRRKISENNRYRRRRGENIHFYLNLSHDLHPNNLSQLRIICIEFLEILLAHYFYWDIWVIYMELDCCILFLFYFSYDFAIDDRCLMIESKKKSKT